MDIVKTMLEDATSEQARHEIFLGAHEFVAYGDLFERRLKRSVSYSIDRFRTNILDADDISQKPISVDICIGESERITTAGDIFSVSDIDQQIIEQFETVLKAGAIKFPDFERQYAASEQWAKDPWWKHFGTNGAKRQKRRILHALAWRSVAAKETIAILRSEKTRVATELAKREERWLADGALAIDLVYAVLYLRRVPCTVFPDWNAKTICAHPKNPLEIGDVVYVAGICGETPGGFPDLRIQKFITTEIDVERYAGNVNKVTYRATVKSTEDGQSRSYVIDSSHPPTKNPDILYSGYTGTMAFRSRALAEEWLRVATQRAIETV